MYQIMIVDDDASILDMVELILRRDGFQVIRALSPHIALELLQHTTPDLFVLDAMMMEMDGIMLCKQLRTFPHTASTPILFLTGQGGSYSVVDALMSGGDDYVRKPFNPRELAARVRALIRRSVHYTDAEALVVRILLNQYRVFIDNREVHLTRVEYELIKYLAQTPYHLHSTSDLLLYVWGYPNGSGDAALVRNHIHNLRRKIELEPERPGILQSRHGRGYMLKARVELESAQALLVNEGV